MYLILKHRPRPRPIPIFSQYTVELCLPPTSPYPTRIFSMMHQSVSEPDSTPAPRMTRSVARNQAAQPSNPPRTRSRGKNKVCYVLPYCLVRFTKTAQNADEAPVPELRKKTRKLVCAATVFWFTAHSIFSAQEIQKSALPQSKFTLYSRVLHY